MPKAKEWNTRYCPTCNSTDLVIDQLVIQCKKCDRILLVNRDDGQPLEDPAWVASGSRE